MRIVHYYAEEFQKGNTNLSVLYNSARKGKFTEEIDFLIKMRKSQSTAVICQIKNVTLSTPN